MTLEDLMMQLKTHQSLQNSSDQSSVESTETLTQKRLKFIPLDECFRKQLQSFDCTDESVLSNLNSRLKRRQNKLYSELNEYIRENSFRDEKNYLSKVFLGVDEQDTVISFFSLSAHSLLRESLPNKKSKPYPFSSAILIGRLAVHKQYLRQGYGLETMEEIFSRFLRISKDLGVSALTLDAYAVAVNYYKKYNFIELVNKKDSATVPMFIPASIIQKLANNDE